MAGQPPWNGLGSPLNGASGAVFVCLVALIPAAAIAQSVRPLEVEIFNDHVVRKAIQCEIGHFARLVRSQKLDREHLRAAYSISDRHEISHAGPFYFPTLTQHFDRDESSDTATELFNIDVANELACENNHGLQLLDMRQCLAEQAKDFSSSSIKCTSRMHVKRTTDAAGKPIFFVTFGIHSSWGEDFIQNAVVSSPPPRRPP